jgi:hypothetical protein
MKADDQTFVAVDDQCLARAIGGAQHRVVYAAPGLGTLSGKALADAIARLSGAVTIILDADADACRIGYGEPEALQALHEAAASQHLPLRRQAGLRIGVLVADDALMVWSPTARSVEPERVREQPNGLLLSGPVVEVCSTAMGADGTVTPPMQAEIGRAPLTADDRRETVEELERNPPAPFDLARRTRVFSSRFQFVEPEVQGAQWTKRKIKLSSLILNADLPESLHDLLDTQFQPFQDKGDTAFEVPHLVGGRRTFDARGERIFVAMTQSEIWKAWTDIRDRYLKHLDGFGWLIRRDELVAFREAVAAFEETLRAWVDAFRKDIASEEEQLVQDIVGAVKARVSRSDRREKLKHLNLEDEVRKGLKRLRVIEPWVRIVLKNVAWESTRDEEFQGALQKALPAEELEGWFEEFTAARQRPTSEVTW